MTYPTCGEISCDECNDRYEKALARIAELEQMVRELVKSAKTKHGKVTTYSIPIDLCHKALALLQPEEETNGQR